MSMAKKWAAKLAALVGLSGRDKEDPLVARQKVFAQAVADCQRETASFGAFPHADTKPLTDLIAAAEKMVGTPTVDSYDAALKHLGGFKDALKKQREAQAKEAKAVEERIAKLPDAKVDLAEAEQFLATVEATCPGVAEATAKIQAVVLEARKRFAEGDGVACREKLKELKKLPDLKALQKASATARARVSSPEMDRAEATLARLVALVAPVRSQPWTNRFRGLRDRLMAPVSDPQVIGEMRAFADDIDKEFAAQTTLEIDASNQLKELAGLEKSMQATLTDALQVDLAAQLQAARGAHAVKDFQTAKDLAASTYAAIDKALKEARPMAAEWQKRASEWDATGKELLAFTDAAKYTPDVVAMARSLSGSLHARKTWEAGREWARLLNTLQAMADACKTIPAMAQKRAAFVKDRLAAQRKPIDEALKSSLASLQNIADILKAEGVDGRAGTADLRRRLDALSTEWEQRCASAVDVPSLGAKGMETRIGQLDADIDAAGRKDAIAAIVKKVRQDAAIVAFAKLRDEVAAALDELEATSRTAAEPLRQRLADLVAAAAGDPAQAARDAATLKKDATDAGAKALKQADGQRETLKKACDEVGRLIESTWEKAKKEGDKKFAPAFEAIRKELATARVMADSRSADAGTLVGNRLEAMRKRLAAMGPGTGSQASPYSAVMQRKEKFDKNMADAKKQLEADVAKAWQQLEADTAKLAAEMFGLAPEAVAKRLDALDKQLDRAKADATIVAGYRQSVAELRTVVKAKLEMLESDGTAAAYAKRLRKRYEDARDMAEKPDKLFQAKTTLDGIHRELEEAILKPEKAVAAQKNMLAAEESTRLTKAEYESTMDVVGSRLLPKLESVVASAGGDEDQIGEVQRMIDEAKKAAKGGDHAGALRQLQLVRVRMQQIERDPVGPTIGSRNQLPADAAQFREAVTTMVREMDALPGLVMQRVPDVNAAVVQRVQAMVTAVRNRFIPGAFDLHASRLSSPKLQKTERRAEREAALAQVRALRALLKTHPTLQKLRVNPFAPLEPAVGVVEQRLVRLESNIRRCVQ